MNICVIGGAGYVGLVTGLGLAEISHRVVNVDVDRERVCRLNAGDSPIYEEGIGPHGDKYDLARSQAFCQVRSELDASGIEIPPEHGTPFQAGRAG